jgi:hypothetical protein
MSAACLREKSAHFVWLGWVEVGDHFRVGDHFVGRFCFCFSLSRKVFGVGVGVGVGVEGIGNHRNGRFFRTRVGDHFVGRFCRSPPPTTGRTHGNPGGFQVDAGGFATDAGRLLDLPQRPPQSSQSQNLLFLLFVQDIAHAHGAYIPPRESMSRTLLSLAGF